MTAEPITLTVYKIEAMHVDLTPFNTKHTYQLGVITAHASGGGHEHHWEIQLTDRLCIGDQVTIQHPTRTHTHE